MKKLELLAFIHKRYNDTDIFYPSTFIPPVRKEKLNALVEDGLLGRTITSGKAGGWHITEAGRQAAEKFLATRKPVP